MSQLIHVGGPKGAFSEAQAVRLVVPVPDCGWLRIGGGWSPVDAAQWREAAAASARAAGLSPVSTRIMVDPQVRKGHRDRFHVAEDVRPSLNAALQGLVSQRVLKSTEWRHVGSMKLAMGPSTGELGGLLVLKLLGVSGG